MVVGGCEGKSGAAEMTGLGALRAGAGLVTVASSARRLDTLELMTEPLPSSFEALRGLAAHRNVIAIGPGLGTSSDVAAMVRSPPSNRSRRW